MLETTLDFDDLREDIAFLASSILFHRSRLAKQRVLSLGGGRNRNFCPSFVHCRLSKAAPLDFSLKSFRVEYACSRLTFPDHRFGISGEKFLDHFLLKKQWKTRYSISFAQDPTKRLTWTIF